MTLILFALACLGGAELSHLIPAVGSGLPVIVFPAGLLVGALIVSGRREWLRLVLVAFAVAVFDPIALHGGSAPAVVALAAIMCAEAVAAAALIGRLAGPEFTLERVSHASLFIAVAASTPAVGALVAAPIVMRIAPTFSAAWLAWWLSDGLGILLTAPVVIAFAAEETRGGSPWRSWLALEALVAFVSLVAVTESVFGDLLDLSLLVPAYVLPFLLWPAMRFGPLGSTLSVFFACVIGVWNTSHGHGPFAVLSTSVGNLLLRAQGAMGMTGLSLLLLASMVAERRNALRERARLVEELQGALNEIKTLRGFIPICAWCHKVRDDEGFWQRLETYLGERTDATFSHSICPGCAETQHEAAAKSPGQEWRI